MSSAGSPNKTLDQLIEETRQLLEKRNAGKKTDLEPPDEPAPLARATETLDEALRSFEKAPPNPAFSRRACTFQSMSAGELSDQLTRPAAEYLKKTAYRIYRTLHEVALEVARARGYATAVTQVSFHIPAEIVALYLDIDRTTVWRRMKELKEHGLVDSRAHFTTLDGRTLADGTVWTVKLHPQRGKRARVAYEDLKHQYRDLEADIRRGRTAYSEMQQSKEVPIKQDDSVIGRLLSWALSPATYSPSLNLTVAATVAPAPLAVLDVPYAPKDERGKMVDAGARAAAAYLGDLHSVDYYRWLMWQLLRLYDRGQDFFAALYQTIRRVREDYQDGLVKKPGALLTAKLKESGLWDLLRSTPPYRVGARPPLG